MINKISCCTHNQNTCQEPTKNATKAQTSFGSIVELMERTSKIDTPVTGVKKIKDRFEELRRLLELGNSKEVKINEVSPKTNQSYASILLTDAKGQKIIVRNDYPENMGDMGERLIGAFNALVNKFNG